MAGGARLGERLRQVAAIGREGERHRAGQVAMRLRRCRRRSMPMPPTTMAIRAVPRGRRRPAAHRRRADACRRRRSAAGARSGSSRRGLRRGAAASCDRRRLARVVDDDVVADVGEVCRRRRPRSGRRARSRRRPARPAWRSTRSCRRSRPVPDLPRAPLIAATTAGPEPAESPERARTTSATATATAATPTTAASGLNRRHGLRPAGRGPSGFVRSSAAMTLPGRERTAAPESAPPSSSASVRYAAIRVRREGAVDLQAAQQVERVVELLVVLGVRRHVGERARVFLRRRLRRLADGP